MSSGSSPGTEEDEEDGDKSCVTFASPLLHCAAVLCFIDLKSFQCAGVCNQYWIVVSNCWPELKKWMVQVECLELVFLVVLQLLAV